MNLLERFVLQHVQITLLQAEVFKAAKAPGKQEAKVELNLSPRLIKADSGGQPPAYQVRANLTCRSGGEGKQQPSFKAEVGVVAVYQQVAGEPLDIAEFTANHGSLTRQLYPLLQQELRVLMSRLGLADIHLPFDLAAQVHPQGAQAVEVSGAVH
jgi:hypothetical protein